MGINVDVTFFEIVWRVSQSLKTYQLYHGEWQQAEGKLRHVEHQKVKLERQQSAGSSGVAVAKSALSRRFRNFEKLSEKVRRPSCALKLASACTGIHCPGALPHPGSAGCNPPWFITVCTVVQDCCKGRSDKYRKWHFWGSCRPQTP